MKSHHIAMTAVFALLTVLFMRPVSAQDGEVVVDAKPFKVQEWARLIQQDYPSAALRASDQGAVLMELTIDASGEVSVCSIVKSSGSSTLDEAGCSGMMKYARYEPALDSEGVAVVSSMKQSIRYVLPDAGPTYRPASPVEEDDWRGKVFTAKIDAVMREAGLQSISYQLDVGESGEATGCDVRWSTGKPEIDGQICATLQDYARFEPGDRTEEFTPTRSAWVTHLIPVS